jgi:L-2-hydroxyglutarate oxidase LhgO
MNCMRHYDITIVGAGLVGLATAYRLKQQQPGLRIAVLEKEAELAPHQSSHNSGVIHSGIYYKPGSLRAVNCQRGYTQLVDFCQAHGVAYELCGKLIAAVTEAERGMLENIFQRGLANGLTGIRKISREEALETEPYLDCREAILVPQTGIVDFPGVAKVLASLITAAGGEILLNNQVLKITRGTTGLGDPHLPGVKFHDDSTDQLRRIICRPAGADVGTTERCTDSSFQRRVLSVEKRKGVPGTPFDLSGAQSGSFLS